MVFSRNSRRRHRDRRGVAATEFAFILPILLIMTFGTIEVCSAIFLKEKVVIAAHEGARAAIKKMATEEHVRIAVEEYLTARGVDISSLGTTAVRVQPDPARREKLLPITVTVTAPIDGNSLVPNSFYTWFGGRTVSARVVMYKEFTHPDYVLELNGG